MTLKEIREQMSAQTCFENDRQFYYHFAENYCTIMFETLPIRLDGVYDLRKEKDARKLAAIEVVVSDYDNDMDEDLCNEFQVKNEVRGLGVDGC